MGIILKWIRRIITVVRDFFKEHVYNSEKSMFFKLFISSLIIAFLFFTGKTFWLFLTVCTWITIHKYFLVWVVLIFYFALEIFFTYDLPEVLLMRRSLQWWSFIIISNNCIIYYGEGLYDISLSWFFLLVLYIYYLYKTWAI